MGISLNHICKVALILSLLMGAPACSIKKIAVNKVGNMLASSGSTFTSDDDPELVAAAIPFGLKLYEGLLAEAPKHIGALRAPRLGMPLAANLLCIIVPIQTNPMQNGHNISTQRAEAN